MPDTIRPNGKKQNACQHQSRLRHRHRQRFNTNDEHNNVRIGRSNFIHCLCSHSNLYSKGSILIITLLIISVVLPYNTYVLFSCSAFSTVQSFSSSSSSLSSSRMLRYMSNNNNANKEQSNTNTNTNIRYYFAYGSNMLPTTMTSLRNLRPLSSTAAVLPNYQLLFDIASDDVITRNVLNFFTGESSAASIAPKTTNSVVHGVLYALTIDDFARVGQTEGFAYQWTKCTVIPYIGNDKDAGQIALQKYSDTTDCTEKIKIPSIQCYTLTKNDGTKQQEKQQQRQIQHIPPSPSYLRILRNGADYWRMDKSYRVYLSKIVTNKNPFTLYPDGLAGTLLENSERRTKQT